VGENMNDFRRTQNTNVSDPNDNRSYLDNVSVNNLNVGRANVGRITLNRDDRIRDSQRPRRKP